MEDDNPKVVPLNSFNAADFRVPASDARGHSVRKQFRMIPLLAHAISVMISSRAFPYKTDSELIRHAIVRHLRWLESIGEVHSVSGEVSAAHDALKADLLYEDYQEIFSVLRNQIQRYVSRGDHGEARKTVTRMRGHFSRMPEGYWRNRFEQQLKEHDWLFNNTSTVNLAQLGQD